MLIQPASSSSTSTGATAWTEITVDLSTAKNAEALDLGSLTSFSSLVIKSMTGAAKLHLNGGDGVTVEEGEARDGLEGETLAVTTEGSTGGTMTLELQGEALMGFTWFKRFGVSSSSSGDYATAAELTAEATRAQAAEDAIADAVAALPSSGSGSIAQEFVSCGGTGAGEGTAAGITYTPSAPTRDAAGSLIPAVAISGSTSTFYNLPVATEIKATDKVFLEINTGNGWFGIENSQDAMSPGLMLGDAFIGVSLDIPTAAVIRVRWSNLGRLTGTNYGSARYNWADVRALGWRWRVRKVSFGG